LKSIRRADKPRDKAKAAGQKRAATDKSQPAAGLPPSSERPADHTAAADDDPLNESRAVAVLPSSPVAATSQATAPQPSVPRSRWLPCSYRGTWSDFKLHRRLDVMAASTIVLVYAIAVAAILGRGTALLNSR